MKKKTVQKDFLFVAGRIERNKALQFKEALKRDKVCCQHLLDHWVDCYLNNVPLNEWNIIVEQEER